MKQCKGLMSKIDIIAFVDSKVKLGETLVFKGKPVISPYNINDYKWDYILIASSYEEEIRMQAVSQHQVEECKLLSMRELSALLISQEDCHVFDQYSELEITNFLFHNPELNELVVNLKTYQYIKDKYDYVLEKSDPDQVPASNLQVEKNVWICWLQGFENAPDIVKCCRNSVYKYLNDFNITEITSDNFEQYVEFPEYILHKWKTGIITNTHFSDLLRLALLIKYGGLWLDATVMCLSSEIPSSILKNDLFMFQHNSFYSFDSALDLREIGNWLIWAKKDNFLLKQTQRLLCLTWETEPDLCDYYVFHYCFSIVVHHYPSLWAKTSIMACAPSQYLVGDLFCPFDPERFQDIANERCFQKLTYKTDYPSDIRGSYYEKLLEMF